ncbi:MAG: ATP-dependent RecD-like DNA helicase [Planctomycetota bacterium]
MTRSRRRARGDSNPARSTAGWDSTAAPGDSPAAQRKPPRSRVLIVDEASMIDLDLARRLLEALPAPAVLVLVGDADQLPSVGSGAVLHDRRRGRLGRRPPRSRFPRADRRRQRSRPRRAGDRALRERPGAAGSGTICRRPAPGPWRLESAALHREILPAWHATRFDDLPLDDPAALLARHSDSRVLLHDARPRHGRRTRPRRTCIVHARAIGAPGRDFLAGEPVVVVRNDPARRLFNGDLGVATRRGDAIVVAIDRPGGVETFELGSIAHLLVRGWATTVHKAQGSECGEGASSSCPRSRAPSRTARCSTTAVTRCRRAVFLHGSEAALADAASRSVARAAGLATSFSAARAADEGDLDADPRPFCATAFAGPSARYHRA